VNLDELNETGLRAALIDLGQTRSVLGSQLQRAEQALALNEAEATGLRRLVSYLDMLEDDLRSRMEIMERKGKS
jgi:hypothetical protein